MENEKWIVYRRMIDLTNEDVKILRKYNLDNKKYIYTGQCKKSRIKQRGYDFINKCLKRTSDKKDTMEVDTSEKIQNILKFLVNEKNMDLKRAKKYIRVDSFLIIHNYIENKKEALRLEKIYDNELRLNNLINNNFYILKNRDGDLETLNDDTLKIKKNHSINLNLMSFRIEFDKNKICEMVKNDLENDIIKQEQLKMDRKKPSIVVEEGI